MTVKMQRWEMDAIGRDRLTLKEAPIPEPEAGEVLVKVGAVSLNYRDKLVIESGMGLPLAFPYTPGSDLAGTVQAVGDGGTRFAAGDRVISTYAPGWIDGAPLGSGRVPPYRTLGGVYPGVLAQYVAFPEDWFVRAPDSLDDVEGSTLPCAGLTAWFALVEKGSLHAGEIVLVEGTGGVALFGLQIAKAHGARAIVVSRSAEKTGNVLERWAPITASTDRRKTGWRPSIGSPPITAPTISSNSSAGAHLGKAVRAAAVGGPHLPDRRASKGSRSLLPPDR